MKIKELYNDNEEITIESYLNKNGISDVNGYLNPTGKYIENPFIYKNMNDGIELYKKHIINESTIYMIQDGDGDGVLSTTCLYKYTMLLCNKLNKKMHVKILQHSGKERGLGDEVLYNEIINNKRDLLIITDAGTNEYKESKKVYNNGTDILVLDHHALDTPIDVGVLINNQMQECNKNGSGTVVTHKFMQALDKEFNVNFSGLFIDLVALSIISDSMDVKSLENRCYLKFGLFNNNIRNNFLNKLFEDYIFEFKDSYTMKDISFNIIPKINAVCRCKDQNVKQRLIKAFLDLDDLEEVSKLCAEYHKKQIDTVNEFTKDCDKYIDNDDKISIICSDDIHRSYSGLIAGKLSDKYNKPFIVGKPHDNECIGSFRGNVSRVDIENLEGCNWAKGHPSGAFGISIDMSKIDILKKQLNLLDLSSYETYVSVLKSYNINNIPNNLFSVFNECDTLWYGNKLPVPVFHVNNIHINSNDISLCGKKKNTIKIKVGNTTLWYFKSNERIRKDFCLDKEYGVDLDIEVICEFNLNIWNGYKQNQIIIKDYDIKILNNDKNIETESFEDIFNI